jgi:cell division protein FtsL
MGMFSSISHTVVTVADTTTALFSSVEILASTLEIYSIGLKLDALKASKEAYSLQEIEELLKYEKILKEL